MTTAKRVCWSDGGEWCNTCGVKPAVAVGECESCRKLVPVTIPQILKCWRGSICFADVVRMRNGELATVVGRAQGCLDSFDVIIGDATLPGKSRRGVAGREQVFPFWWPSAQFAAHESQGGSHAAEK